MAKWYSALYRALTRQYKTADHDDVVDAIAYANMVATEHIMVAKESINSVDAYVLCVARRALGHSVKRRQRMVYPQAIADAFCQPLDEVLGVVENVIDALDARLDASRIVSALPPKYAQALYLHYVEGLTLEEASRRIGVTPECMRKRHERALRYARKLFREEGAGTAGLG